jgi:phosphoglucomutase
MTIHFGTSGRRAVVADEFVFANVGRVTDAICSEFADFSQESRSMIGAHDTRFMGFIGELINEDKIILGGEESAGLSIKGHYPEKDGILACLLAAEAVAARGASLTDQLEALFSEIGRLESGRISVRLTHELMLKLKERLTEEPTTLAGRKVKEINRLDGLKIIFQDDSWLLVRPSGTEPLVRIYAESESAKDVEVLH